MCTISRTAAEFAGPCWVRGAKRPFATPFMCTISRTAAELVGFFLPHSDDFASAGSKVRPGKPQVGSSLLVLLVLAGFCWFPLVLPGLGWVFITSQRRCCQRGVQSSTRKKTGALGSSLGKGRPTAPGFPPENDLAQGRPRPFQHSPGPQPVPKSPPPPGPAPGSATFPFSYLKVAIITYIGAERRGSRVFRIFWNRVPVVWPAGFGTHPGPRPGSTPLEKT